MSALAQIRGFYSVNDMNVNEPMFSFGTTKHRSASISLGDINNGGKIDAIIANIIINKLINTFLIFPPFFPFFSFL